MNQQIIPPAQLFLGSPSVLEKEIENYLIAFFCKEKCNQCATCLGIKSRQFHNILWIKPEKLYTLETLEPVFQTIAYSLEPYQHYFIILEEADKLSIACSNALLKSIEEPPTGYHFILGAQQKDTLLPTIQSRCIVHSFGHESPSQSSLFLEHFINQKDPLAFLEVLQDIQFSDDEIDQLLEELLELYTEQLQNNLDIKENSQKITEKIALIQAGLLNPPMPGSGKIFLKNLFLQMR